MSPKNIIIPVLFLLATSATGQVTKKIVFRSINQAGVLSGEAGQAFTAQTINGIKTGRWFAGAGAGLDVYSSRTFPVFLDVRRDFSGKMNTPYAYIDAGVNFLSIPSVDKSDNHKTSPGLYYDFGLGWKLVIKNSRAILLSAGYSFKQVKEKYQTNWGAPTLELQSTDWDRYNYSYRRLVLRLGLQL